MPARTFAGLSLRARTLLAVLVTAAVVLLPASGRASAATTNGVCGALSVPNPSGSVGTAGDPCLITSDADLDTALSQINADTSAKTETPDSATGAASAYYELTADLDYSQDASNTTGASTGEWSGIDFFDGTFNGDGYTISNLTYTGDTSTVAIPGTDASGSDFGFFKVLDGATVENLTLSNANVAGDADNAAAGGVAVAAFDATITGVSLENSSIAMAPGGGDSYVGGLVAVADANSYADDGSTVSDGGATTFTNDSFTGSVSDYNRTGGIVGIANGPTTVSDDYVNATLSNPGHPVDGTGGQDGTDYYVIGGLVGAVGASYTTTSGGTAAGVSMTNNVIQGTIKGEASGEASHTNGTNYASATVGWATTSSYSGSGVSATASNWSTSNDLTDVTYTNITGSGLTGTDGTPVSAATLQTEATYTGTATGLTDSTTGSTYSDLGWNFGVPGPSGGWAWTGTASAGAPAVDLNAGLTVQNTTITVLGGSAPSDASLLADLGAATVNGTPAIDTTGVDWTVNGSYQATVSASGAIADPITVTIVVAGSLISLAHSSATFQVTTGAGPSAAGVLSALGATLTGGSGSLTVDLSAVNFAQAGQYPVTVSDTDAADDTTPVQATINVVEVSIVALQHQTVYFNVANPPTAAQVQAAAGASLTDASGDTVQGTLSTDISQVGTTVGSYTATITGTDQYGFTTQPVTVTVVMSNAAISIANSTAAFQAGSSPSEQAVISALGATVTGSGTGPLAVDLTGVDFDQPGSYTVTVSDTNADDVAADQTATIDVVPVSIITLSTTTVYVAVSDAGTLAPSTLLTDTAATLTDSSGDSVAGTLTADTSGVDPSTPGIYTATISGTDQYGFMAGPETVTVVVYLSPQHAGTVWITGNAVVGGTLTANLSGWAGVSAPAYQWLRNGNPIPGATSATYRLSARDAGQRIAVEVSETPPGYNPASATSAAVAVAAPQTWTPRVDVLKAGVAATTIREATTLKPGTVLAVRVTEPGATSGKTAKLKQHRATRVRTARIKVRDTAGHNSYSYNTGKLPAGSTTIRFYRAVGKRLVLVRTETVKVSKP